MRVAPHCCCLSLAYFPLSSSPPSNILFQSHSIKADFRPYDEKVKDQGDIVFWDMKGYLIFTSLSTWDRGALVYLMDRKTVRKLVVTQRTEESYWEMFGSFVSSEMVWGEEIVYGGGGGGE